MASAIKRLVCGTEIKRIKELEAVNGVLNDQDNKAQEVIINLRNEAQAESLKAAQAIAELTEALQNANLTPVDIWCKKKGYMPGVLNYKDKIIIDKIKLDCDLRELICPMSYPIRQFRESIGNKGSGKYASLTYLWYTGVMEAVHKKLTWTEDGRDDNYYYPSYTLKTKKGDCDDFSFLAASVEPDLGVAFGFMDGQGHAFNVAALGEDLVILDAVTGRAQNKDTGLLPYKIHYIITKNWTYTLDGSVRFGDILWG